MAFPAQNAAVVAVVVPLRPQMYASAGAGVTPSTTREGKAFCAKDGEGDLCPHPTHRTPTQICVGWRSILVMVPRVEPLSTTALESVFATMPRYRER
jgi:hypothetical protein